MRAEGTCNNTACVDVTVTVNSNSSAASSASASPATICSGNSSTLSLSGGTLGTGATWQWYSGSCGGTSVGSGTSISVSPTSSTTYYVRAEGTCNNTACADVIVTVNSNSSAASSASASPVTICSGNSSTLSLSGGSLGSGASWQWYSGSCGGTSVGSGASISVSPTSSTTYYVRAEGTCNNSACADVTVNVNSNLPISVSVNADQTTICPGMTVIFTATPTNEGSSPVYQWYLNGNPVGTNSDTYSNASLSNNDQVYCTLNSNASCATGNPATSNTVIITVNANLTASVSISSNDTLICPGTTVDFIAIPTNGGTTPAYQWFLNGNTTGSNSSGITINNMTSNDEVYCIMTSNEACVSIQQVFSDTIIFDVIISTAPDSITAQYYPGCADDQNTLYAHGGIVGVGGDYTWYETNCGDTPIGTGDTLTIFPATTTLYFVNIVDECDVTVCVSLLIKPSPKLPVFVDISASDTIICNGTDVLFTSLPYGEGSNPSYEWYLNGVLVGTDTVLNSTGLADNDSIYCIMTSSEICVTGNPATSDTITITVFNSITPQVSISASDTTICGGTNVIFTATGSNEGSSPVYEWYVNGILSGTGDIYSGTSFNNNDNINCVLTSSDLCTTGAVSSDTITMEVIPLVTPDVIISTPDTNICDGTSITVTATGINEGSAGIYEWFVNGISSGNGTSLTGNNFQNNDQINCVLTSSELCVQGNPVFSDTITLSVNSFLPVAVQIFANDTSVCEGNLVTFTAVATNGGSNPVSQWYLNGIASVTGNTFQGANFNNGDEIYCSLTSSFDCATDNPAISDTITLTVSPNVPVSVTISANDSTICQGEQISFTATGINEGISPVYTWYLNGNATSNGTSFTGTSFLNNDLVWCVLNSSVSCGVDNPASSDTIPLTVHPVLPVSINISASDTSICEGTAITFNAIGTNAGTNPSYEWFVNGISSGTGTTFTGSSISNNNLVHCVLTSSEECTSGNPATSATISMIVNPVLPVSVTVFSNDTMICESANVLFTANGLNGGNSPTYQWYLNGSPAGQNNIFSSANLQNNDEIYCVFTSEEECISYNPAISDTIIMVVNPGFAISVAVACSPTGAVCDGTPLSFTATPTNGGTTPTYQWLLNGNPAGINAPTFSPGVLNNGDQIACVLTSSITPCTTNNPDTSNMFIVTYTSNVPVSVSISASDSSICEEGTVTFTAVPTNGGSNPSYQWYINNTSVGTNNNSFTSSGLQNNDQVYCILTSSLPCVENVSDTSDAVIIIVTPNNPAGVSISAVQGNAVCAGNNVTFNTIATYGGDNPTFQWYINGTESGSGIVFNTSALSNQDTVFCIMTSSLASCISNNPAASNTIIMQIYASPLITISAVNERCLNSNDGLMTINVSGGNQPYTYLWSNGQTTESIEMLNPGNYIVTVTDANSCSSFETEEIIAALEACIYIPNIFSPNGDGKNDKLFVRGTGIISLEFKIYDRWGNKVFEANEQTAGWDGTYKGKFLDAAVFVYYIKANLSSGSTFEDKGNVTLIR
ncbi:MAG: hypothetical protein A2491_13525 [Bacteroidetes bacterium RIFOXYC12_FULL_35_7]|nr:MAG: hypothetical protein A2491_13525 [Bacteroidetes bacterium RIFOXYC12_FULL_35_7]